MLSLAASELDAEFQRLQHRSGSSCIAKNATIVPCATIIILAPMDLIAFQQVAARLPLAECPTMESWLE